MRILDLEVEAAKNAAGFLIEEMVKAGLALAEKDGDLILILDRAHVQLH